MSLQEHGVRWDDSICPQPGGQPSHAPCWSPAELVLAGLEPPLATTELSTAAPSWGLLPKIAPPALAVRKEKNVSHHVPLRSVAWRVTHFC